MVSDPNGIEVFSESRNALAILSGGYFDIQSNFDITDAKAGSYTIQVNLVDELSSTPVADVANTFIVVRELSTGLVGSATIDTSIIESGDNNVCHFTIENVSANASGNFVANYDLFTIDGNTQLINDSENLSLAGNSNHSYNINVPNNITSFTQLDSQGDELLRFEYT